MSRWGLGAARRFANRVRILWLHPISRRAPLTTLSRWIRWSRLARRGAGDLVVPFVNRTLIRVTAGNAEARFYAILGLPEFEDMGFILHAVRPSDLFVDVGAYVGGYSVLAGGACGARVIAIEPDPLNREELVQNLALNGLQDRVEVKPIALGASRGTARFTPAWSGSRILVGEEREGAIQVPVDALDAVLGGLTPAFLKMDVEGLEHAVLAGGRHTLASASLQAVLVELNSSGLVYGVADQAVHDELIGYGFHSFRYEPWTRLLVSLHDRINPAGGNTLYIRDPAAMQQRVRDAAAGRVHGLTL